MFLIKIEAYENGSHANQTTSTAVPVPAGWAVVPKSVGTMDTLENFPFGTVEVEEIDGVMTVINWIPGPTPEPEPEPEAPVTDMDMATAIMEVVASVCGS